MKIKILNNKSAWIAGIFFVLILGSVFLFFSIGSFLSPQDKLSKSDVIVAISGGDTTARTQEAIDLYKDEYGSNLLFSGAAKTGEVSNAESMKAQAIASGVPANKVFIEENSSSTYENALFSKDIIEENEWKKIILVTSPYHQRRAYMNFKYILGSDYTILNHSAEDKWSSNNWHKSKSSLSRTFEELSRVFYLLVTKNYSQEAQ